MAKKKKRSNVSVLERAAELHHLGEGVEHHTRVSKASGRCFIAKCSCGWQGFRKWAQQVEATRDAIRHQQVVRQDATMRGRVQTG